VHEQLVEAGARDQLGQGRGAAVVGRRVGSGAAVVDRAVAGRLAVDRGAGVAPPQASAPRSQGRSVRRIRRAYRRGLRAGAIGDDSR
jgi:hypothetical protein